MKPINYGEIIEKAEARRAALEAITPKLQAIYDLWDTLYVAALPINSVNADYEQLDSEAAALLAQSIGVSVSTLGSGLQYLANVFQLLDRPSKDLLEALKPNEEARRLTPPNRGWMCSSEIEALEKLVLSQTQDKEAPSEAPVKKTSSITK